MRKSNVFTPPEGLYHPDRVIEVGISLPAMFLGVSSLIIPSLVIVLVGYYAFYGLYREACGILLAVAGGFVALGLVFLTAGEATGSFVENGDLAGIAILGLLSFLFALLAIVTPFWILYVITFRTNHWHENKLRKAGWKLKLS